MEDDKFGGWQMANGCEETKIQRKDYAKRDVSRSFFIQI